MEEDLEEEEEEYCERVEEEVVQYQETKNRGNVEWDGHSDAGIRVKNGRGHRRNGGYTDQ